VFSRNIAHHQLQEWGLLPKSPAGAIDSPFKKFPLVLEEAFRECWTNNADVMSYLYTGTPALKTDFTRTGKRTYKGAVDDGVNAVTRYYINNFTDGFYHDCLDLATSRINSDFKLKQRNAVNSIRMPLTLIVIALSVMNMLLNKLLL
jgi:hypothetical protein